MILSFPQVNLVKTDFSTEFSTLSTNRFWNFGLKPVEKCRIKVQNYRENQGLKSRRFT